MLRFEQVKDAVSASLRQGSMAVLVSSLKTQHAGVCERESVCVRERECVCVRESVCV